jgi:hypothetical protein
VQRTAGQTTKHDGVPQLAQKIHSLDFANAMTMTEICFASSRFPHTTAQEKSTHAGGIASRVTTRPLKVRKFTWQRNSGCKVQNANSHEGS